MHARARRAIPLIAAALTVIVVAGLLYLRAGAPNPAAVKGVLPLSTLEGRYSVSYDFLTPSLGWSVVVLQQVKPAFWVYRTTDGARSWRKVFMGTMPQAEAPSIQFFDLDHGIFYVGVLYRTDDGGANWSEISLPEATPIFTFASATRGWALASHLYSTVDGGLFWHRVDASLPEGAIQLGKGGSMSLNFRPSGEGWSGTVDTIQPTVYSTVDGGLSWQAVAVPIPPASGPPLSGKGGALGYSTLVVLTPGPGVIALVIDSFGGAGAFASLDRGTSWRPISLPPHPIELGDISFVDARHWWASRWGLLYKTSNAGLTWNEVRQAAPEILGDWTFGPASVIDESHAWLTMTSANRRNGSTALAMTSDGGVSWKTASVPVPG